MEIGGTTAVTDYDQIYFKSTGTNADISNTTLNIVYINSYTPTGGESFELVYGDGFTGEFSAITKPEAPTGFAWTETYNTTNGTLTLSLTALLPMDLLS
ncbi:MAG: hypothetical protein R2771_10475 [Saprospiraceae bacterium]